MDNIVSEAQDTMINQLNFGLPETSQYITDRRFVNYFPSGRNIYSASGGGNKNIRFYIRGRPAVAVRFFNDFTLKKSTVVGLQAS